MATIMNSVALVQDFSPLSNKVSLWAGCKVEGGESLLPNLLNSTD